MGLAQLRAVRDEPELVAGAGAELVHRVRAEFGGQVRGIQVRRPLGTIARDHAEDTLGPVVHGGEHGGVGGDAVTDQGAGRNDAFDSLGKGDPGAVVPDEALKMPQIGGKGIVPRRVPGHRPTSAVMVYNQTSEQFYRRSRDREL